MEISVIQKSPDLCRLEYKRNGHCSLFMKDPILDRLILEYSTSETINPRHGAPSKHYVTDKSSNYDPKIQKCFYSLCDRLANEDQKNSEPSRKTRGLTGWVAVTGHPLRVNSERSKSRLEDIPVDNPETHDECTKYGTPIWGNHIAEFARDKPDWSKRFLAVPIRSLHSNTTVGVLRYTCIQVGSVLTQLDLHFLESIANLVSVISNLEWVKIRVVRDYIFDYAVRSLKETGDISSFIEYMATSLDSKIVSLYINLNLEDRPVLRLMDAFGISGSTGELRDKIHDYSNESSGLTWEIYKKDPVTPVVYNTVLQTQNWKGLNTGVFYEKALSQVGIESLDCHLEDRDKCRELLSSYNIKLMGTTLKEMNQIVGVVKAEFPISFDFGKHYDIDDQKFLKRCSEVLAEELFTYKQFISTAWFEDAGVQKAHEFAKMMNQVVRLRIFKKDDNAKNFWEKAQKYAREYNVEIKKANDMIRERLSEKKITTTFGKMWSRTPEWMKTTVFSEAFKRLLDVLST